MCPPVEDDSNKQGQSSSIMPPKGNTGSTGEFAHLKAAQNTHADHTTEAQKHMASQSSSTDKK